MAELQPPEDPNIAGKTTTTAAITTVLAETVPDSTEKNNNVNDNLGPSLAPKRQRRPSVRLGEIGYQPATTISYDSQARRPKPWRFHTDPGVAAKTSRSRPLTNLVNGGETLASEYNLEFVNPKLKSKRPIKRVRTNWASLKVDDTNEELRGFENGGSESPLKEQSPVLDSENGFCRPARVPESRDGDDDDDYDGIPESNSWERKCRERNIVFSDEREGPSGFLDGGVRNWLIGLGLGRYAPVFEIHEVDDEILPMLTLADLKDMGINAVGSRRKMYSAIQKLQKRFS